MILGGTLTALFAAALMGCMVSAMLYIANNKEDFLYIYDIRDMLKVKLNDAKVALNEYGRKYREKQLTQ